MLEGLRGEDDAVLSFVRLFYGQQSQYFWENDSGEVHIVLQGERAGRRNDAVAVLTRSACRPRRCVPQSGPGEHLFAFLDDIYVVSKPGRVGRNPRSFGNGLCGGILGSRSITERHRCGTAQGSGQTCATGWNGSPRLCVRMHKCGGGPCCPQTVKVSKCSGPHWDIPTMLLGISRGLWKNTKRCLTASRT